MKGTCLNSIPTDNDVIPSILKIKCEMIMRPTTDKKYYAHFLV